MKSACFSFFLFALVLDSSAAETRPNVLLIVSDDQGYVDAGFQGGKDAITPHLDKIAASGVRFSNGYASHPFCSPTRAGLLAGRYQARFGHEDNPFYAPNDEKQGLPLSERLLPEYLKAAGYRTGWIGKWHLGASMKHSPWSRGFDESYGFLGGGHMFRDWTPDEKEYSIPLVRNGKEIADIPAHLTTAFGEEAAAFIRRNDKSPWFLYLAFNAPHIPHQPSAEALARFAQVTDGARRKCLAQISMMDSAVGEVMGSLDATGQTRRTLVIFLGDNGGAAKPGIMANNGPLRDGKGSLYEGGIRVPFFASWPGTIPAGSTFEAPVISLDAFATSLAAAGVPQPGDRPSDGTNLLPHLTDRIGSPPHQHLFWHMLGDGGSAMRSGRWKLIRGKGGLELYDLVTDPGEKRDVAFEESDVLPALRKVLEEWEKQIAPLAFEGMSYKRDVRKK